MVLQKNHDNTGAIIQFAKINLDDVSCSECDQIAFAVTKVIASGAEYEVPLYLSSE
jgi:glutamate formiminotransferase